MQEGSNVKGLRVLLDIVVTLAAATVLGLLAYQGMGGANAADSWAPRAVLLLDGAVVLATIVNVVSYRRDIGACVLTMLPGLALLAAFAGKLLGHTPPPAALVIYDFYLVYWYAYLLVYESRRQRGRRW